MEPNKDDFKGVETRCKVWDTFLGKFWVSPKGKSEWHGVAHAKNAVNANPPPWMQRTATQDSSRINYAPQWFKFSEQNRLVIVIANYVLESIEIVS